MRWGVQRKQTADKRSLERQGKRNLLLPFFLAALVLAGGSRMTAVLAEDPLCARAEEAGRAGVFLELSGRVRDIRASAEDGWKVTVTVYFPMPSAEESGACSVRSRVLLYLDRLPEAEPGDPVRISGTFRAFEHATNPG